MPQVHPYGGRLLQGFQGHSSLMRGNTGKLHQPFIKVVLKHLITPLRQQHLHIH